MSFIQKHLPLAARIDPGKLQRVETPLIPYKVVREAFINALCHRDYTRRGGSIALAIYDDRMELFSHGGLLPTVTIEQIKSGHSELRNPTIAEVFYRGNMIERWGRGVPDMIKSCAAANDLEPEFVNSTTEFKVIFRFPKSIKPPVINLDEPQNDLKLTERQNEIVTILSSAKELKMKEILGRLKNPPAERTLRDDLADLREAGIIGSRGHARTAVWFLRSK
jgi:ATP-dependent DNA helicase RecG